MGQHFKLEIQEFSDNVNLFNILEIKAEQVVGKGYEELSSVLKTRYRKLILVNHPDKGGDKDRFDWVCKAHEELKKYIKPLESGNPCVKVNDGRLTEREFHYRKKLFDTLKISEEEAVGKNYIELISILKSKDLSFEEDLKSYVKLISQMEKVFQDSSLGYFKKVMETKKLTQELNQYQAKPGMQLLNYIAPLEKGGSLIKEDKKALALKFIERKNALLYIRVVNFTFSYLTIITVGWYLSWWVLAFDIVCEYVVYKLVSHYMAEYRNGEISTDEFMNKMSYIGLVSMFRFTDPLAAFSVYLFTTNFIANGLTVGGYILGPLLLLAVLIETLALVFSKGCKIYAEKYTKDLLEEDPRDRVQKETDLLKWYDPRKLLMPIIMPIVRKFFAEVANEFAERNFDEVKTDMSDVNTKGLSNPQAIEFAQQTV